MIVRLAAGLVLGVWLAGGLVVTLQPAHPAPGQTVEHNFIPLRTIGIYLANLDSPFWVGQMVGNLLLLLPVGLLGPVVLSWMDRWLRVLVASLALSTAIELAQLGIPDRSAEVDDVLLNVAGAIFGYAVLLVLRIGSRRPLATS
ncbi:MAG: VanZ family protein [Candidatus Limnocylindria bacterium]